MAIIEQGGARQPAVGGVLNMDPYEAITSLARPKWRGGMILGYSIIFVFFGIFVGFAAFAPLASSVIAPGSLRVEREPRIIQHPTGGVIKEVAIREGEHVTKGQILLVLDPTRGRAEREILSKRYYGGLITQARLEAERDGASFIELPPEVLDRADDPGITDMIASEQDLFASRRAARKGEVELMHELIAQTRTSIGASEERLVTVDEEVRLIEEELKSVRELYAKGLERITRVRQLERGRANLMGTRSSLVGQIAQQRQRISELELRIIQADRQQETDILSQLDAVSRQIREAGEQLPVSEQNFDRLELKSPTDGRIVRLQVNTDGAVIGPGQVLMEIVPDHEELLVVARINPRDIDALNNGVKNVTVRLTAFSQRFTHPVEATLVSVSADVIRPESAEGKAYYRADIRLNKDSLEHILHGQELVSGMPAMALLGVGEKTLLTYLLDPLIRSFEMSLREP